MNREWVEMLVKQGKRVPKGLIKDLEREEKKESEMKGWVERPVEKEMPTMKQMDALEEGDFCLWRRSPDRKPDVCVRCIKVEDVCTYFVCPFCRTDYKKDGTPYKNAKRVIHFHGRSTKTDFEY